jgi:hypothetical protein
MKDLRLFLGVWRCFVDDDDFSRAAAAAANSEDRQTGCEMFAVSNNEVNLRQILGARGLRRNFRVLSLLDVVCSASSGISKDADGRAAEETGSSSNRRFNPKR